MEIWLSLPKKARISWLHHHRHEGCHGSAHEMGFWIGSSGIIKIQPFSIRHLQYVHPPKHVLCLLHIFTLLLHCLHLVWHRSSAVFPKGSFFVPRGIHQTFRFDMIFVSIRRHILTKYIYIFSQVSNKWFAPFAVVYTSSLLQHLYEVLSTGGSILTWWNEQRIF